MLPHTQPRQRRNSSKVNLLISFVFHATLVAALFYFAARQGFLGKQLQKISVEMVKEKPPPKPKPPETPPVQPPKVAETPKPAQAPKPVEAAKTAPPPTATVAPPSVAPPAAELPSFEFEGGKAVISSSDPVQIYKNALESAFRAKWNRPQNLNDDNFVAEVRVTVDHDGQITHPVWEEGSGNTRWDDSVRAAIAAVTRMDTPPPTNFPPRVTIRFDVKEETETVLQ
jgi:periplasmic protein TonB